MQEAKHAWRATDEAKKKLPLVQVEAKEAKQHRKEPKKIYIFATQFDQGRIVTQARFVGGGFTGEVRRAAMATKQERLESCC